MWPRLGSSGFIRKYSIEKVLLHLESAESIHLCAVQKVIILLNSVLIPQPRNTLYQTDPLRIYYLVFVAKLEIRDCFSCVSFDFLEYTFYKPKLLKNIKNNNIYIAIFFYLDFFRLTVGQKYDTNLIDRSDLESVLDLFTSSWALIFNQLIFRDCTFKLLIARHNGPQVALKRATSKMMIIFLYVSEDNRVFKDWKCCIVFIFWVGSTKLTLMDSLMSVFFKFSNCQIKKNKNLRQLIDTLCSLIAYVQ